MVLASHPFLLPLICYLIDNFSAFRWTLAFFHGILSVTKKKEEFKMKWTVFLQDSQTGKFKPYNIFEHLEFRLSMENLFKKQYPKERFLNELEQEIHYFFWAKIEWEIFITIWPPYIDAKEISRIISEYHINRTPEQRLPERIDVNVTKWYKIDVYNQLQANWERFADYMWTESQK